MVFAIQVREGLKSTRCFFWDAKTKSEQSSFPLPLCYINQEKHFEGLQHQVMAFSATLEGTLINTQTKPDPL